MGIQERFAEILEETKERFERYRKQREGKEKLVEKGKIFDVNPAELIEQRLSRLRFDARAACASMRGPPAP